MSQPGDLAFLRGRPSARLVLGGRSCPRGELRTREFSGFVGGSSCVLGHRSPHTAPEMLPLPSWAPRASGVLRTRQPTAHLGRGSPPCRLWSQDAEGQVGTGAGTSAWLRPQPPVVCQALTGHLEEPGWEVRAGAGGTATAGPLLCHKGRAASESGWGGARAPRLPVVPPTRVAVWP